MALQTKTITANGSKGHHKFTLNVTEESVSKASNDSTMSFSFVLSPIQANWDWAKWGDKISYSININENEYSGTIPNYDGVSTVTLKTGTLPVPHNEDGSKTINISFNVIDSAGQSYTPGNAFESDTMVLTKIPRASSISVSNYDLGQNPNIVIGRKVDTFTSTLSYKIGNRTGVLVEKYNDKNYVWQMSEELINQIKLDNPKNRLIDAIVYCDTYDGATQIGSQTSTTFKLTITDKPVIIDVVRAELNSNISALTDKVLRSISQNQFTINATAPTGTTIASYKVTNGTQNSGNVASNIVNLNDIQTFYENGGILKTKFVITCIDARGNISEEYSLELGFIDYVNVSINKTDAKISRTINTASDALLHMVGNFYNGLIGETQNKLIIQYKFREQGTTDYSELKTISANYENNTFKIDNLEIENEINYQENYEFVFNVMDSVNDADDMTYIFTSSIPVEIHHKNGAYIKEIDTEKMLINNKELPKVENTRSTSTVDTYSCNYINKLKEEKSYALMRTNVRESFSDATLVTNWSENNISIGEFVCQPANNRIFIPKGSATVVRVFGSIAGNGYTSSVINLENDAGEWVARDFFNHQAQGNKYFKLPAWNNTFTIDTTKDHYLYLQVGGYNSVAFSLNNGFGLDATFIGVEKIK